MTTTMRACVGKTDFLKIGHFLRTLYEPDNRDGNWFESIWEYAYTHPLFDESAMSRIGVWEDAGTMTGVALYETRLGEAFFQVHPAFVHLKPEMLTYAEQHLAGAGDDGDRYLKAYVNDFDDAFERLVRSRGYQEEPGSHRPLSQFVIDDPFPPVCVPDGFRLKSLADENDLVKMDRVLWRGFNHVGEPPTFGPQDREKMQSGPHFRKDLAIVVEAPTGDFVSYAGLWFDSVNEFGYVEPVATDPDYRRSGLGTAAVLEGIRRCAELGATVAYVGSDKPFYLAMGFKKLFTEKGWSKCIPTD